MTKTNPVEQMIRKDTAKHYKEVRKILSQNHSYCEEEGLPKDHSYTTLLWLSVIVICLMMLFGFSGCAQAYTNEQAIKAVIGEAEGEGSLGMTAIACAIRNRGTLKGVYGEHAYRVTHHKYSQKTRDLAVSAWDISGQSEGTMSDLNNYEPVMVCDFIHGAQYWKVAPQIRAPANQVANLNLLKNVDVNCDIHPLARTIFCKGTI